MLHATVKYRAQKIQVRELKCHRQNSEHKVYRDCIVLWRAFAWMSQSTTLHEGPSQNADENNLMQKDEREYHPFYMGKNVVWPDDTSACAHLAQLSLGI